MTKKKTQTTELSEAYSALVRAAEQVPDIRDALSSIELQMQTAQAIDSMRSMLSPAVMQPFMNLAGSRMGFRCDKPYQPEQLKDVVIEAVLRGLPFVGNHFNVIAGNLYVTREGYAYLLSQIDGFSNFRPTYGVPIKYNGGSVVECSATWVMNGSPESYGPIKIPVKTDQSTSIDAVLGKASRKFLKLVFDMVTGTGTYYPDGDVDDSFAEIAPTDADPNRQTARPQSKPRSPQGTRERLLSAASRGNEEDESDADGDAFAEEMASSIDEPIY